MAEALPIGILARLTALAVEWEGIAQQRDASLAAHKAAVLTAIRAAALPDLLTAVVQAATNALDAGVVRVRRRCPGCDRRTRVDGWRPRQVRTACGLITLRRPWYVCAELRRPARVIRNERDGRHRPMLPAAGDAQRTHEPPSFAGPPAEARGVCSE